MSGNLELEAISIRIGDQVLLEDFSVTVQPSQTVSIMGPSGCGKSSLLSWIAGVSDTPLLASGKLRLNGVDVLSLPPEKRRIGILFQDDMLFPHFDVLGNLMFAVPRSRPGRRDHARAELASIGLESLADRPIQTLSGGQKARISLLRALLAEPLALLLDEPFSALDQELRGEIRSFVFNRIAERQLPAILVTHDPADAEAAGGPILRPWLG